MTIISIKNLKKDTTLKKYLLDLLKDQYTSSKISKSIDNGDIKVNGKKSTWNYILKENDELRIYLKIKTENHDFLKSKSELKVIYEDENIIVVNKPRGLVCQKDANEKYDTLNSRIKKYLFLKNDNSYKDAHLVHRLDKYTFGLCVAGKNLETIKLLNNVWNTNAINKYYRCYSYGYFKNKQEMLINYVKFNEEKQMMEIDNANEFNKKIVTSYIVLKQYRNYAELEVKIDTGKKHQIRIHLSSIDHPILGDSKYNKINLLGYKYPCLCSYRIEFNFDSKCHLNYLNNKKIVLDKYNFK